MARDQLWPRSVAESWADFREIGVVLSMWLEVKMLQPTQTARNAAWQVVGEGSTSNRGLSNLHTSIGEVHVV